MKFFTRLLFLVFVISASSFTAKGLTAGFTADVTSGCAPLVVHFTNTSTGATSYSWNLGNGTTSTLKDVSTSYLLPGTYTVTLVASGGGTTATKTMTITVYPQPTVNFTASKTAVCPGAPITFTSTTIGGVPGIVTLLWDFGDGTVAAGNTPTHAYSSPGTYNVTLSATNSKGCVATLVIPAYILVYTPAAIAFASSPATFCSAPGHAVFTNYTTGTPAFTYAWTFGDGGISTATNPVHDYLSVGSYNVGLTVTDGHGCVDNATLYGYISVHHLVAAFTAPGTACLGVNVHFTNTSGPHISSYWTFGDGGSAITDNGDHIYTTSGTYTVTLIVYDGSCYDTVTQVITILPKPAASFTQNPFPPCPPPVAITFTGTVPGGSTVLWHFGDGASGTGATVTHTYARRGIDTIKMITTDSHGCVDTTVQIDTLYDMYLSVIPSVTKGCAPLTVTFDETLLTSMPDTTLIPMRPYPYPVASYIWDFGDGYTGTGKTPTHVYADTGVFTVTLTIFTSNGCTISATATILVGYPPAITVTATPTHICFNKETFLTVTIITGPTDDFIWDFGKGGGTHGPGTSLSWKFPLPGTFTLTVTPSYHGCPGPPYVLPYPIIVDSPKAAIGFTYHCYPRTEVDFGDSSLGDNSREWFFGDGTTDTIKNPVHFYPFASVYTVTLTTFNTASGCKDTAVAVIDLRKPVPNFTADHIAVCKGGIVHFTPTVTGGTATGYDWYVDGIHLFDAGHFNSRTYVLTDTFYTVGLHTVLFVITDQLGCRDSVLKTNYITCALPTVSFTVSPASGCVPLRVTFTDVSTDAPGVFFTNYSWAFGDGATAVTGSPAIAHTYTAAGTDTVMEIVTDNIGCIDTGYYMPVTAYQPAASFTVSNNYPCIGIPDYFTNTSVGVVSSLWTFGDGATDTTRSTWHSYADTGSYTVTLTVTDVHGCTGKLVVPNYIDVTRPAASFYMSDSFSICPPLNVTFYNTSVGAVSYAWTFGDGNTSVLSYPSDLYIKPGYDTVMLVATNTYGCSDTAYGHATLYGYAGAFQYTPDSGCAPLTVFFKAKLSNVPSIVWDFADGITSAASMVDSISHTYIHPGKYLPKLVLSDNTGCSNSSWGLDTIRVDAVDPGFTTVPNPVCQNALMYFKDTTSSYFTKVNSWLWTFTNGDTSTLEAPAYQYNTAGIFPISLRVADSWGCSGTVTQNVVVFPPPVITVSPDTIVCLGDAATLIGYGGVSYVWAGPSLGCTACNPAMASPLVASTYTVTGTDAHGCIGTDTATVRLKTKTVSTGHGDTSVCYGVPVQLLDSGATKFDWQPQGGLSSPTIGNPVATPKQTTDFEIIAQLGSCIPDTNYIKVTIFPIPTVNAGPDQTEPEGLPVHLHATGTNIDYYEWAQDPTLSCDTCLDPVASPGITTTYAINVTTTHGCIATDSVTIHVYCDKGQVFIPNTFTPNGDGEDDVFYPRGRGIGIIKSFRIYNRWGQLLFERHDIAINDKANAWDGTYMGATPRPDVYVWVVDAVCDSGEPINLKGDVTIIR